MKIMAPPIPDHLVCPITLEVMDDPVICSDGITYNRDSIEKWLETNSTSPKTNKSLIDRKLIPNFAIKKAISQLKLKASNSKKRKTDNFKVTNFILLVFIDFKARLC